MIFKIFIPFVILTVFTPSISGQTDENPTESPEDTTPCPRLKLEVLDPRKYIYSCKFPSRPTEGHVENCTSTSEPNVESGTRAYFRCRPPLKTRRGGDDQINSWLCKGGHWVHKPGRPTRLVCYQIPNHPGKKTNVTFDPQQPTTHKPMIPLTPNPTVSPVATTKDPSLNDTKCPALLKRTTGVRIECVTKYPDGTIVTGACNKSMAVGTEARYYCEDYFESTFGLESFFRNCKEDGDWTGTSEQFACVVRCGVSNTPQIPLITNGMVAVRGQWPWSSALYLKGEDGKWGCICGATLITPLTVLTAAHCVTYSNTNVARNETEFRVDLGKDFLETVDEFVQSRKIKKVILNPSYSFYGYDSDMAILVLVQPIRLTYYVQPICFPQTIGSIEENFHLSENTLGTVAGFGNDIHGRMAERLQVTQLPVVGQRKCQENVQDELGTSIQTRSTTYCAGFGNDTNVCRGDSGSGMYFPLRVEGRRNKWYIEGIVSVGLAGPDGENCDPKKYAFFTKVGSFATWIVRTLSLEEDGGNIV